MKNILNICKLALLLTCAIPLTSWSKSRILFENTKNTPYSSVTSEVLQSDKKSYRIRIKINYIDLETLIYSNEEYNKISIDGFSMLEIDGEPSLPKLIQHIVVPTGSKAIASIIENKWTDVTIGKISPFQGQLKTNNSNSSICIKNNVYSSTGYFPQLITESEKYTCKGIENIYITACPFKYYPSSNKLSILNDFTIHVDFVSDQKTTASSIKNEGLIFNTFNNNNLDCSLQKKIRNVQDPTLPNYLIIVGNIPSILNSQELSTFCRWKALKGFKTKVVSTQAIGHDCVSIKNYIKQQVANGIEQVLFIGDEETIPLMSLEPMHKDSKYPELLSDYWYGCLDGSKDIQAEIPIGRFIVKTLSEFSNIIRKTISYESSSNPNSNKALFFANAQHDSTVNYLEALETIRTEPHVDILNYQTDYAAPTLYGGNNAINTDIFNHINEGQNLVTYNGHSVSDLIWLDDNSEGLAGSPLYQIYHCDTTKVQTNSNFIFISTGCLNGNFTKPHSMIRSFTNAENCAIAYLGDTYPMWTYAANRYLIRFYQRLLNESNYHLGYLNLMTHLDLLGNGSSDITNAFGYICAGDPTLEIWTGIQNSFQNVSISMEQDSLVISVDNATDYKVNVINDSGSFEDSYISTNSICKIPKHSGIWSLAIDKHNYIPYVLRINTNSNFIQNETINDNSFYYGNPIEIGFNVTSSRPQGNVIIEPSTSVFINKGNGVVLNKGFECKSGAQLNIE